MCQPILTISKPRIIGSLGSFLFGRFTCSATRPSHCPTVRFFFQGRVALPTQEINATPGKRGADAAMDAKRSEVGEIYIL